jgi:hypothetical protein
MKCSVLFLVFVFSFHHLFSRPLQVISLGSITDETPYSFSMKASQVKSDLIDHIAETTWPWKRRRGCHGGRKQKRRNKKRIKRSRA